MSRSVQVARSESADPLRLMRRRAPRPRIIGDGPAAVGLRRAIEIVAGTRASVLVTGETGTGKGLVARAIHDLSGERHFVHVDCASLSPTVIESELFGHERGAFTGASERRVGRLERAGTGTVFLDEIADIEPRLQAKLLRVLQDRVFERVGGWETQPFQARIVAATNRDLAREIEVGSFRADLYYRLQVVELHVPPLRARAEDLPLLVRELAARLGRDPEIEPDFYDRLGSHNWPGNIRELANFVERLLLTKPEGPWQRADLDGVWSRSKHEPDAQRSTETATSRTRFEQQERAALEELLSDHRWNVSAAARALGFSRGALRGRMARLGI